MMNYKRYQRVPVMNYPEREWPNKEIQKAPIWCSVDLRDGNQALPMPMNPEKKLEYFKLLCAIGFKEIEVSFPSASQDDFDFVRNLIEKKEIPSDVRISVLTQAREPLIRRTVESLVGVEKAILHLYVATSDLHEQIVFGKTHEETMKMAVEGTKLVRRCLKEYGLEGKVAYEFSPEEFTDSDPDYVIEVCKAVKEAWGPSAKNDFIANLPQTVERRPPHHYADMIAYFIEKYPYMDETTVSVHSHNDQGCAVASSEFTIMAGAERVEGTLFGHGERTGNVDLCTLALNLASRNIPTGLDFSDLPHIVKVVENATGIDVHERHPYAGQLAFTAFSGSHQDAIRKGIDRLAQAQELFHVQWKVPYLHIDPADVGRKYEKLIRINSQSGKGGVGYILETKYGLNLPPKMREAMGYAAKAVSDHSHKELHPDEIFNLFKSTFENVGSPYSISEVHFQQKDGGIVTQVTSSFNGKTVTTEAAGNGRLDAVSNALKKAYELKFTLVTYQEHALEKSTSSKAIAYVGIQKPDGTLSWGAGVDPDIIRASIDALVTAINNR